MLYWPEEWGDAAVGNRICYPDCSWQTIGKLDGTINHLVRLAEPGNIPHHCINVSRPHNAYQAFTHEVCVLYIQYSLQQYIHIQVFKT